ncbi:universal stress protein [Actinoplanes sp. L3-i22]|uniref:universal stress protein n=1 Tax=Actinoplanes sp. L3-i22 TaxID=2836373 RepID=UPI001C793F0A|nr:universal stress protein [Actinoplanes sp. L3-i22]BCY09414.1 universal stress protein UspA [Actinoplanes sp. L3-i22]
MSDLDKFNVEQQARQRAGDPHRISPYHEMINRYLRTFSYVDPYVPAPARTPVAAARPAADPATAGTVIVGVDDMPTSHVSVDQAAIEAELHGAALLIVHAGAPPRDPRLLEHLTERVRSFAPSVPATTQVTVGMSPAELLLAAAGATDLIVVGHRHGRARGALRRSVADHVAAEHTGPVLVVREPGWPPGPELATRPLVVGANGSAASTRASEFAVQEAKARGCDIVRLRVTKEPVEELDRTDRIGGVTVRSRTVAGNPVNEIVDASSRAAAVVLGRSAGRGRLSSVDRAVLHHAHCPIFFVG